jgi:integrase
MTMRKDSKARSTPGEDRAKEPAALDAVLIALEQNSKLGATRVRDLRSAVKRVSALLGEEPAAVRLDLPAISARLGAINPVAVGMTAKRFTNIRSDFLAAVKASGLMLIRGGATRPMSPAWVELFRRLSGRRPHIGLSRLARYASSQGIEPKDIDDHAIDKFMAMVRAESLHRKPGVLHRQVTKIWSEAARDPTLGLRPVSVPFSRRPRKRVDWKLLRESFRTDVDKYLAWCAVSDPFAADARSRPISKGTLRLRRDYVHAAVTALVASGIKPSAIRSLADLVSVDHFKRVLRCRLDGVGGEENVFNHHVGRALVQIAREWVATDAQTLVELKRLLAKMPLPVMGLTDKNKQFLRQFEDPAVLLRLYELPGKLWAEVKRETRPTYYTLAKAQTALAIAILCYIPLRLQNLVSLAFDTHVFLREGRGAISTVEIPAAEVKNGRELSFDIPPKVARMLIDYRDKVAPKIIGRRPSQLFVTIAGKPKGQLTVAYLITSYLKHRAGIVMTVHQFRHLSAKVVLDREPGAFETVKQFLGHASLTTTVGAYAGIDSRRAARRHHQLVEQALAAQMPARRHKRSALLPHRPIESLGAIISRPLLGGLHHQYCRI